MRPLLRCLCLWLAFLPLFTWAAEQVPVPPLRAPVTDLTRTLTAEQVATLDAMLRDLQSRKGSQLAVLMLPATAPETIEQYSIRVADAWRLGRKDVDDGVLLLIAKDERAVRIEVGYGLEGVLNDATANRIIRQLIVPQFRDGNYYQGIHDASVRIIQLIDGEVLPEPASASEQHGVGDNVPWPFLIFAVVAAGSVLRGIFGRLGAAGLTAGGAGLLVWFFVGSLLAALVAAVFAFAFVLGSGGSGWGHGGRGGWTPGPRGGWGGGFGGGGFSGGGGGFGGGGASGRW